jgi:hypothetical protein
MSIPTPKVRAPQAKTVSAADLLAGAAKKGKASDHLVYTGEAGQDAAARWLELNARFAETERELGLARDKVLDVIRPWHEESTAPFWSSNRSAPTVTRLARPSGVSQVHSTARPSGARSVPDDGGPAWHDPLPPRDTMTKYTRPFSVRWVTP